MLYVAICDDDAVLLQALEKKVRKYYQKSNELFDITIYSNSQNLKFDIQEGRHFDLILSDIEMPDMDGMELAKFIKKYLPESMIIFVTSHLKYAIDAFELDVFRYIPKEMLEERLERALADATQIYKLQKDKYYMIHTSTKIEKIPIRNILYITKSGKYAIFYLLDGTATKIRKPLAEVYEQLDPNEFVWINRGEMVNLAHIVSISRDRVIKLKNNILLSVSFSKFDVLKNKLGMFWEEHI